jgi:hypothetical protein
MGFVLCFQWVLYSCVPLLFDFGRAPDHPTLTATPGSSYKRKRDFCRRGELPCQRDLLDGHRHETISSGATTDR